MGTAALVAVLVGVPLLIGLAVRSRWWALGCPGVILLLGSLLALSHENDPGAFIPARTFVFVLTFVATGLVGLGAFVGTLIGCAQRTEY